MDFNEKHFMKYFLPLDSLEPVPNVASDELEAFNSNVERLGMEVFASSLSFLLNANELSVRALVNQIGLNSSGLRQADKAGPYVDSAAWPPVQRPGLRIYRIMPPGPESQ